MILDRPDLDQVDPGILAYIESLEAELAALQAELADPALYKKGESAIAAPRESLSRVQSELAAGYERWSELEALAPKD